MEWKEFVEQQRTTRGIWERTLQSAEDRLKRARSAVRTDDARKDVLASRRNLAEIDAILAQDIEAESLRQQLAQAQHCPDDLIDIVEATWGDNATVLAYCVDEVEGQATLLLRNVGDWQMYERDADGYWEKTGEGTGVKHTAIRLTKAGAEQLDRWHTDDMLPDDDEVQP